MAVLKIDDKGIERLERHLKAFKSRAYPFATKATLNKAAFNTQTVARANLRKDFILRNKWTEQSVRVEMARTLRVANQSAHVGSIADYLEDQEFGNGAVKSSKSRVGHPIATPYASGEGSVPRKRLPRAPNRRKNIRLRRRGRAAKSQKQKNAIAIATARKGTGYAWLKVGKRKGIYRVTATSVRKVWDLSRKSVRIKKRPWLGPATDVVVPLLPRFYRDALKFQLRKHGIFVNNGGR
jgi:hypothetical protein